MASLSLYFLGSPEIIRSKQQLTTDRRKAVALLAYLALEPGDHRRDSLATLLWGDFPQESALAYLRRTLWELNQILIDAYLETDRSLVSLISEHVWVDAVELSQAAEQLAGPPGQNTLSDEKLKTVIDLYRGDFLAGFSLKDAPQFDEWQLFQSEALRRDFTSLLAELCLRLDEQHEYDQLLTYSQRWAQFDPLSEAAHRQIITAYAKNNQRSSALRHFELMKKNLQETLDIEPESETLALVEAVRRQQFSVMAAYDQSVPPISSATVPGAGTLPSYSGPFIGRNEQIDKVVNFSISPPCRLLTILGPGGIGKTRLCVETAKKMQDQFPQGVFFVSLVQVSHSEQLLETMAQAVGCELRTEDSAGNPTLSILQQLSEYLHDKKILVVLDNFEHLVEDAVYLSDLLIAAPQLKLIVTSRIRLQLKEENLFELDGLEHGSQNAHNPEMKSPSAELFIDRARQFVPDYLPDSQEVQSIERIGLIVDGSPLAIELSAAWIRLLTAQEIAAEIEQNLDFLTSSARNVPVRHQSIRAVFETSWKMLSQNEQAVFSKLSLYRSGFSRDNAAVTAGASLIVLARLADQSLIKKVENNRYSIHELLRQFGVEKLSELDLQQTAELEFSNYHLRALAELQPAFTGRNIAQALEVVDREFDNLRLSIDFAARYKNWQLLLDSFPTLLLYLQIRFRLQDGWLIFSRLTQQLEGSTDESQIASELEALSGASKALYCALLESSPTPTGENCEMLFDQAYSSIQALKTGEVRHLALLAMNFGQPYFDPPRSFELMKEAQQYYIDKGNIWLSGMITASMAEYVLFYVRDIARAEELYRQSLQYAVESQSLWFQAMNLQFLANAFLSAGKYQLANQYSQQSLAICQELNLKWHVIDIQLTLGRTAVALGEYEKAIEFYTQNLDLMQQSGDRIYTAVHFDCLGYAYLLQHKYEQAGSAYQQALELYQRQGYAHGIGMALSNLGDVARAAGDLQAAVSYYQQGLNYLTNTDAVWGVEVTHKKLGQTYWEFDQGEQAIEELFKALKLAVQLERDPEILEILASLIPYYLQIGMQEHAQRLMKLIISHPATAQNVRQETTQWQQTVEIGDTKEQLPPFSLPVEAAFKSLLLLEN